ncbi:glycosyl transferase family 1 [Paenibacillus sp. FSL A5-0031]|uniref:glycosyltransferase family 4 protein n=1 Tax=Paenibacillus sp. FSL A5-0031 TaxID=1920420 RepID=UPI00096C7F72|nr:glycosyltransferase family 4 protein [Paenibacillus sp. FSL A5-0031]OME80210.1 glycosyl transferase family 1 [Paenibacillus sp. FSL A5-0031]
MKSRRKLKVWVMTNEFHPNIVGGLGIVATSLTKMLSKIDVEVMVLCSSGFKQLSFSKPDGRLRIIRIPKNSRYYSHYSRAFKASTVLRAAVAMGFGKPDLIHVHSTDFAAVASAAGSLYRIPIIYTCHSLASKGITSSSGKNQAKLFLTAKRIVVPSRWQANEIKRLNTRKQGRITIIPHGVKSKSRQTKGSPTNLLYVGRLLPSKGINPLIKAVALLYQNHKNVSLTIVGSGSVAYQSSLHALAKRHGIAGRIRWIKKKPNEAVQRMYATYGAVIVPSKKESFCLVALEAMANGVPLVSTLSGGLKEFVNTRNAQVIHSVDSSTIAGAIAALWKNPAKKKQRLTNAHSTAARYKWPTIARRYKSLFMNLRKVNSP